MELNHGKYRKPIIQVKKQANNLENPLDKKQLRNIPADDVKILSLEVHPEPEGL